MQNSSLLNPIQTPTVPKFKVPRFSLTGNHQMILGVVLVVLLGICSGWILSGKVGSGTTRGSSSISTGKNEAGILDESTFKGDTAEGVVREGGMNGEGTHHLERDGGPSQTIYLASTAIDLQAFVDKKVKVWGESQAVKKAGWFMDVVKIKAID